MKALGIIKLFVYPAVLIGFAACEPQQVGTRSSSAGDQITSSGAAKAGISDPGVALRPQLAAPARERQAEVVLRTSWGAAASDLGRRLPDEAAPEGPMSFAVAADGTVFVLDQVYERVQVYKAGAHVRGIGLDADSYQDLALLDERTMVLMDRLVQRALVFFDTAGRRLATVPLEGEHLPEGGLTSGLFVHADGVWVEVEHRDLVKIATRDGRPAPDRVKLPGRFSIDGKRLLQAARDGSDGAVILRRSAEAPDAAPAMSQVRFTLPVLYLFQLTTDASGRVYLAAHLTRFADAPSFEVLDERRELVVLDASGAERERIVLEANAGAEEQLQSLRVTPDGSVYHLELDDLGVTLRRYAS